MVDASTTLTGLVPKINATSIITTIIWLLLSVIIFVCIIAFVYIRIQNKKYGQYKIVIYEKDSTGNTHEYYDKGGVFLNKKTGIKGLWLQRMKRVLDPNNIPYVTATDRKGRIIKTVYLIRTGISNFRYINITLNEIPKFTIGEEDLNWGSQELESIKRTYLKKSFLEQLLPIGIFIVVAIIIMIILLSLFGKFSVLKDMTENLLKVTQGQAEITTQLANLTGAIKNNPNTPPSYPVIK